MGGWTVAVMPSLMPLSWGDWIVAVLPLLVPLIHLSEPVPSQCQFLMVLLYSGTSLIASFALGDVLSQSH